MRANEFITEGPLPPVAPEKQPLYRDIWNYEYAEPGVSRSEYSSMVSGEHEVNDTVKRPNNPYSHDTVRNLGTGAEAAVVKVKGDNSVIKILGSNFELKNNAHLQYLLASKKYASTNPYLPRILSVSHLPNTSKHNPNVNGYVIRTERLWPATDPEVQSDTFNHLLTVIYGRNAPVVNTISEFAKVVRNGIIGPLVDQVVDPNFVQVRKIIVAVGKKIVWNNPDDNLHLEYIFDLHNGNMMFRRTPYGPQLVITDPLYYPG